ncbi:MAG: YceI family protein [Hyphomonadaceae bacterium]|nr:YceI family protein [Hyphomonadaceae bacterium]
MLMRSAIIAAVAALAACTQPAPQTPQPEPAAIPVNAPTGAYTLDPHHTTVTASARHFGLSSYVLRFNGVSGTLNFNAEDPAQSSVEATVAIDTLDTPYSGDRDFDAELQNSEWLDAVGHPTATFRSTSVERTGPNTARVTGDITIKGVTAPITLDVSYNASHATHPMGFPTALIGFSARGEIRRSQFGVLPLMETAAGGDGVSDAVAIQIEAEFTRPVEGPAPSRQPAEPVN